ncbi:MAG: cytochrome c maturation protein CcmE [Chloroflexi bacterium]|nr:cytochrome c maturation protein CcmE [Chloroflexota bacterium]
MTEDTIQPELEQAEGGLFASKGKFIAAAIVLIGALGYLGFIAFQSATVYSYTVSELAEMGPTPDGKLVRVSGSLVEDSFVRQDGSTIAHFRLTDTDAQDGALIIAANYEGVLPDLFFNPHSEIILEGQYGTDGIFHSQNVLVKCPSKYIEAGDESTGDYSDYEKPAA